jgi:hypothetical protein
MSANIVNLPPAAEREEGMERCMSDAVRVCCFMNIMQSPSQKHYVENQLLDQSRTLITAGLKWAIRTSQRTSPKRS